MEEDNVVISFCVDRMRFKLGIIVWLLILTLAVGTLSWWLYPMFSYTSHLEQKYGNPSDPPEFPLDDVR